MISPRQWMWRILCALLLCMFGAIAQAADAEDVFWDSVVKGNAQDEYELYLKQYPKGRHAQEARQKLEASREKARAQQDTKKTRSQAELVNKKEEVLRQKEVELKQREEEVKRREEADAERRRAEQEAERRRAEQEAERKRAEQTSMRTGHVFRDCADCPEMVVIPAGGFEMGVTVGYSDERPVHSVGITKPIAIGKTEVAQAQWRAVMGNNASNFVGCDDCPVDRVSWEDVQQFIRRLVQKTGKTYRLPSEAEWEYACRAGGRQEYCGSDNADAVAWHTSNSGGRAHAVKGKQPNAWGLYDMSGNVFEWTEDCWNANYNGAPTDGSAWMSGDCGARVLRSGSWGSGSRFVSAGGRNWGVMSKRGVDYGFRLVRILP